MSWHPAAEAKSGQAGSALSVRRQALGAEGGRRLPPETSGQMVACWARIRGRLRDEVGEVEYRTWLRQMTLHGIDGDEAVILLPTRFLRDWVNSHYGDRLRALWQAEEGAVRRVEIRVAPAAGSLAATAEPAYAEGAAPQRTDPP